MYIVFLLVSLWSFGSHATNLPSGGDLVVICTGSQRWNMQCKFPEVEYKYERQIIFNELHGTEIFCLNN